MEGTAIGGKLVGTDNAADDDTIAMHDGRSSSWTRPDRLR
jgi:hypothetical protein